MRVSRSLKRLPADEQMGDDGDVESIEERELVLDKNIEALRIMSEARSMSLDGGRSEIDKHFVHGPNGST